MHGECLETGKVRFATARAAHAVICKTRWGKGVKVQPRRAYYCKCCQGYHLTSKTDVWERRRRLNRKVISARVASVGETEDAIEVTLLATHKAERSVIEESTDSHQSVQDQGTRRSAK